MSIAEEMVEESEWYSEFTSRGRTQRDYRNNYRSRSSRSGSYSSRGREKNYNDAPTKPDFVDDGAFFILARSPSQLMLNIDAVVGNPTDQVGGGL